MRLSIHSLSIAWGATVTPSAEWPCLTQSHDLVGDSVEGSASDRHSRASDIEFNRVNVIERSRNMTTGKGLRRIRWTSVSLALTLLFGFTVIALAEEPESVPTSSKKTAKDRESQIRDMQSEYAHAITEFIPRPGKHVIKVKRGWSGNLIYSKMIQDVQWTIVATQHVGATNTQTTDSIVKHERNAQLEPQTERRVRVRPRDTAIPFNVQSHLSNNTTPPEQVALITGGVNVVVDGGPDGGGVIDVSADRVVIWTHESETFSPEMLQTPQQPFKLYLEGNVVIRRQPVLPSPSHGEINDIIRAKSAFYDAHRRRILLSNAELQVTSNVELQHRADQARQDSLKSDQSLEQGPRAWRLGVIDLQKSSKSTSVTGQGTRSLEDELPLIFPSIDPVLKVVTLDEFSRFVAVRKGTATIRYVGQSNSGHSHCELQIEVEADTSEIDAALKEAIPQSQIKVTEIRSIALLTGTVPTLDDLNQAKWIATQFYPDFMSQLKVATPPATPPAPEPKPLQKPSPKTENSSPQKKKSGVRAELKELRSEVQALRQDIRELNELLAKRAPNEDRPQFELPTKKRPEEFEILRSGLLSFDASWCGPCRQMKPIVDRLKQAKHPIQSVDVDAHPELCEKFKVESIPCFVLVKDGREIERVSGITTEDKLKELMKKVGIEGDDEVPLSIDMLPRELLLTIGETKVLTFDHPVSILTSKADVVVIERGSPTKARIRAKTIGEVELQFVYRDTRNSERIRVRVVDDHLTRALSKTIALNINDQPLTEILREFTRLVDANIHLDTEGLEDEGVSPDVKRSFEYSGVSARTALKLILKPLNLDFIEDNEVIKVTSRVRANGELYTVVYNVKDLVEAEAGNKPATTGQQLVESLQQVGDRDCWEAAGGAGTVRYMKETSSLVVRQTYSMHYQVADFLADRRRPKKKELIRGQSIDSQANRFIEERLGVVLVPLTPAEASELPPQTGPDGTSTKWRGGLRVAEVKRPHLLRKNDVIVGVNTSLVTTLAEVTTALNHIEKSSAWPQDPLTGDPVWPTERGTIPLPKQAKYRSRPQSSIKLQVVSDGQIRWLDFTLLNAMQQRDRAEPVVVVYSVADLVTPIPAAPGPEPAKPDWFRLIDLIVGEVEPNCWISNGGTCSIVTHEQTLSLVIRAPRIIHDQVSTVLNRERRKLGVQACFEFTMIAAPDQPLTDLTGFGLEIDPGARCALLNAAQSKKVIEALQANGGDMHFAPQVTVFNGQTAYLRDRTWSMKDGTSIDVEIQTRGLVAPDRRSVGVNLALNADANRVVEELTRRTINVPEGHGLLLDVTEELRAKSSDKTISGRAYILIKPKVIVLEEENEWWLQQSRVLMKTPRGIVLEEEELLDRPKDLAK